MNPAAGRLKDLPSILLLTSIVAVASQRLAATGWTADLEMVFVLAMMGVLLGLPMGLSRFRGGMVFLLVTLYSLVIVPFTLAGVFYRGIPWLERMALLGGRLMESISVLAAGNPLEDYFLILVFFIACFWFIGIGSAYSLTRSGNFVGAVLPSGLIMLLLLVFDTRGNTGIILTSIFIFLVLLLLGRMYYSRRRETWRSWRIFPAGEARTDINLTILIGATLLVLVAFLLPVSPRQIPVLRIWWQDVTRLWSKNENLSNVFAGLEVDEGTKTNNFYGPFLTLGDDAPTSDAILFHIQNNGTASQERYYWRVRSYDLYQDGIWGSSEDELRTFVESDEPLSLPGGTGSISEFQILVVRTKFGALITPARPTWVDRPSSLTYLPVGGEAVDPIIFQPNEPVKPGEGYLVQAIMQEPSEQELREAGTDYPDWVSDRFFQLPSDLPPAIINLANQLTLEAKTPYDKAEAITAYLRREIVYSAHMEVPPAGRNILTWFLFDYKQGFCNYYATAEVILLRAAGIPARLTVGFSEGQFEMPGWYTVRQQNAHAWPEVYFPGVGWVEFEPTTSEPVIVRSLGEITGPASETEIPETPEVVLPELPVDGVETLPAGGTGSIFVSWQNSLAILLILLAASILPGNSLARRALSGRLEEDRRNLKSTFSSPGWVILRKWLQKYSLPIPTWLEKKARMAELDPLALVFNTVYQTLRAFKPGKTNALTPREAANELLTYLPEAEEEIKILLEEYQPATYNSSTPDMNKMLLAAASLRNKARLAQPSGWLNRRMNRGKFINLKKEIDD